MPKLEDAVNIGPVLARHLRDVGIESLDSLIEIGPFEATLRLEAAGLHDCTHSYLALEGAVAGVRWMQMPQERRDELAAKWHNRANAG
ncbi:MAG: TfoX/Sxy family protein [Homoserinimonas sp.]|nr:TfoX/Sxy family protein [Homoserinimonas sp.]MCW5944711.1 TfoX/Sxy family DNA transformation protein [Cryobacterium sp.]